MKINKKNCTKYNMQNILVIIKDKRWYGFKKLIQAISFEVLKYKKNFIYVTLTNDAEILPLNLKCRNKNYATDILSFPLPFQWNDKLCLGDIILSYDSIKLKSKQEKLTIRNYLKMIIIHGILHLLGYDHNDDKDWLIMNNIENILYKKFINV